MYLRASCTMCVCSAVSTRGNAAPGEALSIPKMERGNSSLGLEVPKYPLPKCHPLPAKTTKTTQTPAFPLITRRTQG